MEILNEVGAVSIIVRLILAVIMGGIIGLERGIKGRAAGMRTYMLVAIGSALVMITSQYLAQGHYNLDVSRMGAQVISGIGFLGAGTIIITRDRQVRGLTTAAGLWASATMGLAIGVGFYLGAIIGMFFILFTTGFMHSFDNVLLRRSRAMDVYIELEDPGHIRLLLAHIRKQGIRVSHMEILQTKHNNESTVSLLLSLFMPQRTPHIEILADFGAIEYVRFAEEV